MYGTVVLSNLDYRPAFLEEVLSFARKCNGGEGASKDHDFLTILPKLSFDGQHGQANFDHDHPQNSKIFMVKMVNPNFIITISTIPDFLVVEIFEIC